MPERTIYFVTNRKHKGSNRWRPDRYTGRPSDDGADNLRFGEVTSTVPATKLNKALGKSPRDTDGSKLTDAFRDVMKKATIEAYEEDVDPSLPEHLQEQAKLGSERMFKKLKDDMSCGRDVVVLVHGYAVKWEDACASAFALQESFEADLEGTPAATKTPLVVLFTWPSDGSNFPYMAYRSDRVDARCSGAALARAVLKLRDFIGNMEDPTCDRQIHLVCHSMGNFVLQSEDPLEPRAVPHAPAAAGPWLQILPAPPCLGRPAEQCCGHDDPRPHIPSGSARRRFRLR